MLPNLGDRKLALVVVGIGIRAVGQMTFDAVAWIKKAEKVLYVVNDAVAEEIVCQLNPSAESLAGLYADGKLRTVTYQEMVERILDCVRSGKVTCVVSYGHPGVFSYPAHEAMRRARAEGYAAKMLPGISAEDCLFADLGIDPSTSGCQSFESTEFLINGHALDVTSHIILWQIGVVGDWTFKKKGYDHSALPMLAERLCQFYQPNQVAYLYEAATFLGCEPVIRPITIASLPQAAPSPLATLYIPPARPAMLNQAVYDRLNAPSAVPATESWFNQGRSHAFGQPANCSGAS
jgi:precorrin-6B methylase 1